MREVLVLALPLIVSTLSWTLMNFTDRVFLVWYSADAVAAALPAGMMAFMVICFPLGVAAYVNTFVAQYQGAKRPESAEAVGRYSMAFDHARSCAMTEAESRAYLADLADRHG